MTEKDKAKEAADKADQADKELNDRHRRQWKEKFGVEV